jgi:hypothetical protein
VGSVALLVFIVYSGPRYEETPKELASSEAIDIAEDLELFENYELIENLDVLDDLELIEELDDAG